MANWRSRLVLSAGEGVGADHRDDLGDLVNVQLCSNTRQDVFAVGGRGGQDVAVAGTQLCNQRSNVFRQLMGENDFTSFRASQCQSRTPWRNVSHLKVTRLGDYVIVDIKANAFVHHMVRNIVGSLMEIGCGNQPESWMAELLAAKDRKLAAATAKAAGLYLVSVDYPEHFGLPKVSMGPLFLAD